MILLAFWESAVGILGVKNIHSFIVLAVAVFSATLLQAEDSRVWTSLKGSTLDASLVKMDGANVILVGPDRKEKKLLVTDLSLADRQYLVENAQADEKILTEGVLSEPEKDVRLDPKTFKKRDKKLSLTGGDQTVGPFDQMETEHFLIAYAGDVRPHVVAEIAERLWHGMAFYHMNFRRDWGDKRRVIFVVEDRKIYKALGDWYAKVLMEDAANAEAQKEVAQVKAIWDKVGGNTVALPKEEQEKGNFHPVASVFNIDNGIAFKKVFTPFPTHCLAGHLLNQQMGGVGSVGQKGYFTIVTGHAYFKEIKLAEKTETHLIDASGSSGIEITSKSGYQDGTAWAKILKTEVKRGKLTPNLQEILGVDQASLNPAKLVLVYSFSNYLQSNPKRICAFARLVRRVESNNTIPEPIEFAKIYGFDSVEKMEADWVEYIKSSELK